MKVHILGVCGTFMAGVALTLRELGNEVEGSDLGFHPPMSDQLELAGIKCHQGFDATVKERPADLYLIGNVVRRGNPLFESVLAAGARFDSGPHWFADNVLSKHGRVVAVAGTHGKTTTTAMVIHMLREAGMDPSYLLGGLPGDKKASACFLPDAEVCVIEADEYDTALFDKRPKFSHYWCDVAILNNIEFDHADIYPDLASVCRQFGLLARCLKPCGVMVANIADANVRGCVPDASWHSTVWFNDPESWRVDHGQLATPAGLHQIEHMPPGSHNQSNLVAAVAACAQLGVSPETSLAALESFKLPGRRMEVVIEANEVKLIDDFAHHPTSLALAIETARSAHGPGRVVALLEPGSYTMRSGHWANAIAEACAQADLLHVYTRNQSWDVAGAMSRLGQKVALHEDIDELRAAVIQQAQPRDILLMLSNSSFGGLRKALAESVAELASS